MITAPRPRIIFSHGRESGPWGTKIRTLADIAKVAGLDVESIDYSDLSSPDQRAERLASNLSADPGTAILVGSSMGGYASAVAAGRHLEQVRGLFLLAPALFMPGYAIQDFPAPLPPAVVVHGWGDDVIPVVHSIRFAQQHGADLLLVSDDHRLKARLDAIADVFRSFLARYASGP